MQLDSTIPRIMISGMGHVDTNIPIVLTSFCGWGHMQTVMAEHCADTSARVTCLAMKHQIGWYFGHVQSQSGHVYLLMFQQRTFHDSSASAGTQIGLTTLEPKTS